MYIKLLLLLFLVGFPHFGSAKSDAGILFGLIADCQYHHGENKGTRFYNLSDKKLQGAVNFLNQKEVDFSVHLGDFIDRDFGSYDVVLPIWNQLEAPGYHVLGNHEFSVEDHEKERVPSLLGLSSRYYEFKLNTWRFVVLDGNDLSLYAYPKKDARTELSKIAFDRFQNLGRKPKVWNGGIGSDQFLWLEAILREADANGENVILFSHFPVFPENVHNLWNAPELLKLLDQHPSVKAYFSGHNHKGNFGTRNGVSYITVKGMVDTTETAYATVQISEGEIFVKGFGRQESYKLNIPKEHRSSR